MQERRFTPSPLAGEGWDGGERPGRWVPPGGILTLRVAGGALDTGAPAVVIEFADTGLGIAPEHLPKVMEPFFTTKAAGKGTGLGLAICRRIVQEHHGTFTLASEVGTGTTVRIALPLTHATIEP
jgi:signal transduction histidine kinase